MASSGNQNQQPVTGQFDVQRLFNPISSPSPPSPTITTLQNANNQYILPSSAASYPPPTGTGGPYAYQPPQTNPILHHQFHITPPPFTNQQTDDNLKCRHNKNKNKETMMEKTSRVLDDE
ncbi:hypothetical protein E3N88_34216 [Mikania micrantha]|uniref:Uncharacterized protein n=1 Tax=Mikania micrantha TaxID=192012 RepID=A0A5N6LXH4_9ASTR|nr:hypothetical protein E3N88_34216 [Mikania micrantha]